MTRKVNVLLIRSGFAILLLIFCNLTRGQPEKEDSVAAKLEQQVSEEKQSSREELSALLSLGELAYKTGQCQKAVSHFLRAEAIAVEMGDLPFQEKIFNGLSSAYEGLDQQREAYSYFRKYVQVMDSLRNREQLTQLAEARSRFEAEKQQAEILRLQTENEYMAFKARQRFNWIMAGAGGLLLVLLGGFLESRRRQQRREEQRRLAFEKERAERERERAEHLNQVNSVINKFVPHEFLRAIGRKDIGAVKLGDQVEKEVTVSFSDIRDYTRLSENMTPEENFRFVNKFTGRMGPLVQKHRGFINQYLGDGFMAIFQQAPEDALDAAIEMQKKIREYNLQRIAENEEPIKVGIGLHTGPLIMGIIGDEERSDAATVSDSVNTASRMEGLTRTFGASILLSEDTYRRISDPERYQFRFLGKVQVKGKKRPVGIYECLDGLGQEEKGIFIRSRKAFNDGLDLYFRRDFGNAFGVFKQIVSENPKDDAAQLYLEKVLRSQVRGVEEGWEGVVMVQGK